MLPDDVPVNAISLSCRLVDKPRQGQTHLHHFGQAAGGVDDDSTKTSAISGRN